MNSNQPRRRTAQPTTAPAASPFGQPASDDGAAVDSGVADAARVGRAAADSVSVDCAAVDCARVEAGLRALAAGDASAFATIFHWDAFWHVAPAGVLKGNYRGRDQIVGYLANITAASGGTYRIGTLASAAAGERVYVQYAASAERNGRTAQWQGVLAFTLRDGLVASVHEFVLDHPALVRFWS